jgi:acyl-coenzyme A thioesterase PaaI-like protein
MGTPAAFQDFYPEDAARCYGCGHLNERGYRLRTFWDGEETVSRFTPEPWHTAVPGYVYGGLLASLVDCHGTGTAAGAGYRAEGREPGSDPPLRYVTASLRVDYLKPTPLGPELVIRGRVLEVKGRKVVTAVRLLADGVECVRGEVVAVRIPDSMAVGGGARP